MEKYMTYRMFGKKTKGRDKAATWFAIMKYESSKFEKSKELFLKQNFSETHQWEVFIRCTEAGKNTITVGYQEQLSH